MPFLCQPLQFFLTHRVLLWKALGVVRSGAQGKGVVNGSLARPVPNAPEAALWVALTELFQGEPATRAKNPGHVRGSKPVAEVYIAARVVGWIIRYSFCFCLYVAAAAKHPSTFSWPRSSESTAIEKTNLRTDT